jgi:STE24 endopeptidase
MDRSRWRLPSALVAATVAAEAAVLLFRPREGMIDPAPVSARSYFSAEEIDRARAYARPQLALHAVALLIEGGVLMVLVRRPPRGLLRRFRRPLPGAAAAGAGLSVLLTAATLPVGAASRQRALEVGLSTQSWRGWAGDVAKSTAIGGVFAGAGGALLIGLVRRFPRGWWAPGAAAVVAIGAGALYAGPVLLDPIFNRFTPLPEGETRAEVLRLAAEAGVDVGEVFEVDASRRTTAANAYVVGLGPTKRVVLFDTLLERFSPEEARVVVAHELAHVRYRDVPHGLLYLALVAPASLGAVRAIYEELAPEPGTPESLPAFALALGLVSLAVGTVSNQLSRRIEARADAFALRLTRTPEPFIGFERRITVQNVGDPDPPRWVVGLLGTHPPTVERIGYALAYAQQNP